MRANADLVIAGARAVLVPYRPEHVATYQAWMRDPALLAATASEPLTLAEEVAAQASWAADELKCTFIVLDPAAAGAAVSRHGGAMAGDVNLYWNDPECSNTAEIEVMVAEAASRRRGVAAEALRLLMAWAILNTGVQRFRAKIGVDNAPSLALFCKLGFAEVSRSEVFQEATLELAAEGAAWAELAALGGRLDLRPYDGGGG